jgi:hypothetical protein
MPAVLVASTKIGFSLIGALGSAVVFGRCRLPRNCEFSENRPQFHSICFGAAFK